jgi:uncharacterized protein YfeS
MNFNEIYEKARLREGEISVEKRILQKLNDGIFEALDRERKMFKNNILPYTREEVKYALTKLKESYILHFFNFKDD